MLLTLVTDSCAILLVSSFVNSSCGKTAAETRPDPHLMSNPTLPAQEQLLSILQSGRNRLEYLTANDWNLLLQKAKRVIFKKGDRLIQHGKQSRTVYFLIRGSARIEADFKTKIAAIGPGEICGEMGFLENSMASATVTAEEDIEACSLDWSAMWEVFELFPHLGSRFYRSVAVNLSKRLREQIVVKQSGRR